MKRTLICAFLLILAAAVAVAIPVVVVFAQPEPEPITPTEPTSTFAWTVFAWVIYAVAGILANVAFGKEPFDAKKLAKSVIIAALASVFAFAFKLAPGAVVTQWGGAIDTLATVILNTAPGLWLIYVLDKLYQLIMNAKAKMEAAHAAATGPGPPAVSPS